MKNKFSLLIMLLLAFNGAVLSYLVVNRKQTPPPAPADREEGVAETGKKPGVPRVNPMQIQQLQKMAEAMKQEIKLPTPRQTVEDVDGIIEAQIREIGQAIAETGDLREKLRLVAQLSQYPHPQTVTIVRQLLTSPEAILRGAALNALIGYTGSDVFDIAAIALDDPDPRVRNLACLLMATARPETPGAVVEPLLKATADEAEPNREVALAVVKVQPFEERLKITETHLKSSTFLDVISDATLAMQSLGGHRALETLFVGLDNPDPALKEATNKTIHHLVGYKFENREIAEKWWAENKSLFNDDLTEKL